MSILIHLAIVPHSAVLASCCEAPAVATAIVVAVVQAYLLGQLFPQRFERSMELYYTLSVHDLLNNTYTVSVLTCTVSVLAWSVLVLTCTASLLTIALSRDPSTRHLDG